MSLWVSIRMADLVMDLTSTSSFFESVVEAAKVMADRSSASAAKIDVLNIIILGRSVGEQMLSRLCA